MGNFTQSNTPRIQAGKLRHKIDIVRVSTAQDSTGGSDLSTDVLYANVWASIEAITGRETYSAGTELSSVSHKVTIRYIGAAPSWQSLHNYSANDLIKDSNGYLQQAQNPGLTGSSAPTWGQDTGAITLDGTPSTGVTWKNIGKAPNRTGVTAAMQVWFEGRTFQIEAVLNPDERTKMLILLCVEINDSLQQAQNNG